MQQRHASSSVRLYLWTGVITAQSEEAAEPVTAVWQCVPTSVSVKPLDIFMETSGQFSAQSVVTKKTDIFTVCGDQSMMVLSPKPNQSQNTTYKRSAETYNANIHFWFGLRVRVKQTELLTQWRHRVITNHQGETTIVQNFVANQSLFVEFDLKKITSPSWWIRLRICPLWELNGHTFSTGWDFSVWTKFVGWLTDGHWHRCQLYFCPHLSLIVETFYDFIWFSFFFQGWTQHSLSSSQKLL